MLCILQNETETELLLLSPPPPTHRLLNLGFTKSKPLFTGTVQMWIKDREEVHGGPPGTI